MSPRNAAVWLVNVLLARAGDPIEADAEPWAPPLAWAERRQHAAIHRPSGNTELTMAAVRV
jgi:hypothetical protein